MAITFAAFNVLMNQTRDLAGLPPKKSTDKTWKADWAAFNAHLAQRMESPDGAETTPGGPALLVNGVSYRIAPEGHVLVGALTSQDSGKVKRLRRVGNEVLQAADWGVGLYWFSVPANGTKGVAVADPTAPPPLPPPPPPVDVLLRDFKDIVLIAPDAAGFDPSMWGKNPYINSTWGEPKLFKRADQAEGMWLGRNATIDANGALILHANTQGFGQVQAGSDYHASRGVWTVEMSLDFAAEGLVPAPVWLMDGHYELDIEIVGKKGMYWAMWDHWAGYSTGDGMDKPMIPGDLSGFRGELAIRYLAGEEFAFLINGVERIKKTPADFPAGRFPTTPLKVYHDIWAVNSDIYGGGLVDWAGRYQGLGEQTLTIHKRSFKAL